MRSPTSHKGDNGSVAIIGGSLHQHGAPLFSALSAEASGVDLVYVFVPECHREVAKNTSLNFQVHTFGSSESDEISAHDRTRIVEFLATIDIAVIGPGLSRTPSALLSLMTLLEEAPCPLVIDASALQEKTLKYVTGRHAVLTPHLGELERMGIASSDLSTVCIEHACTILKKGIVDTIVSEKGVVHTVEGGNAGLTVGGTGDALAGLIAGLIAQGVDHAEACIMASTVIKRAGDVLAQEFGFAYTTRQVTQMIPKMLKDIVRS